MVAEAMAVMKVAGPFVAPIITKLAEKASPYFGGDATAEKLDNLRTIILPQIQLIIEAAGADKVAGLGPWLSKLKAAALEADDVVDEWEYKSLEDQVSPPAPLLRVIRECRKKLREFAAPVLFKTKLMKRVDELEKIASEAGRFLKLLGLHRDSQPSHGDDRSRDASGPSLPPAVVGREREREYWVHVLTSPTDEEANSGTQSWMAPIHAICGIGGAGKTTLAQFVFNDPRIAGQFGDMRIWVHVPRKLDARQATGNMIEFITKGESPRMETLAALQAKLREIFDKSKHKILLVLDDLWADKPGDRIQLDTLLQPLNEVGRAGSRVLITTRMEGAASLLGAASIVPLEELDDMDCRSIVLHYASRRADELDGDQAWILNTIVSKLKNSPLAARLVGNRLRVDDWRMIGDTFLKGDILEGSKSSLLWSFKRLPLHLKSCFAFCSLYPKGFVFGNEEVDELVRFWIAQGFVEEPAESEGDLTIEEKGKRYFNELRFFSFFQQHPQREGSYVIHDLLNDLAEDVSQGHCFRIEDIMAADIPPTVIHLSIVVRRRLAIPVSDLMKLANLRTFLVLYMSGDDFKVVVEHGEEMFKKLAKLRLLHFGRSNCMDELNSSVGKLKHLRYLQGGVVVRLPESLGTLYHLQYINICTGSGFIDSVPKSLNNLVKLRHVYPDEVCSKMDDIGKMTSLQRLLVYDANRTKKYGLQQLEKLQQIRGRLTIEGLEFVKDTAGATIGMLEKKRHLEELILKWDDDGAADVDSDTGKAVLEGLEPHPNLKKLDIWYYNSANAPIWMLNDRRGWLPNLTSLKLMHCPNLTAVPNLPSRLRELTVENCPKLMRLYPFPCSLEVLEMVNWLGTEAFLSSIISSHDKREQQQQQHHLMSKGGSYHQRFALRSLKIWGDCVIEENTLNEFLTSYKFSSLSKLEFRNLPSVTSLLLGPVLTALENLSIIGLENLRSIRGIGCLTSLKRLTVKKCPLLATAAGAGGGLPSIKENLEIDEPFLLPVLLQEHGLNSLVQLEIRECSQDVPFSAEQEGIFQRLTSLKSLSFVDCDNLPSLPVALEKLSSIEVLKIQFCSKIESLLHLPCSLKTLRVEHFSKVEVLYNLPASLEYLIIRDCSKIESFPNLPCSLTLLMIYECYKLESLRNLPSSLNMLWIEKCHPRLKDKYNVDGPLHYQIDHIRHIYIL